MLNKTKTLNTRPMQMIITIFLF